MGKLAYAKETPRLTIKVVNGETNEIMFEVPNRTCLDIGDFLSDNYISEMMKNKKYDVDIDLIRVLVIADFYKQ